MIAGETPVLVHNNNGLGACGTGGGRPDGETVFSGHGGQEPGTGLTRAPKGTCVVMYCTYGDTILDSTGNAIETGAKLSQVRLQSVSEWQLQGKLNDSGVYLPGDGSGGPLC
ncbi:putative adhesin [Allorhizocola rhizosphaerae]|uniref:putative adhesin n=1 Tax=Allorhizocola rhizosphaerae TaxID=1872709 RepID=UPI003CCC7BE8